MSRPNIDLDAARRLAVRHFDISAEVRELPSTDDRNFVLLGDADQPVAVLKVIRLARQTEAAQRFENEVLQRLEAARSERRSPPLPPTPVPVPARDGGDLVVWEDEQGQSCGVRVVSFLNGTRLRDVAHGAQLQRAVGTALGALDALLAREFSPDDGPARASDWDLLRATDGINRDLASIEDLQRCRLVEDLTARFVAESADALDELPRAWIHGDANDDNVLVRTTELERPSTGVSGSGGLRSGATEAAFWPTAVSGLIDFGDLVWSARVCDPAIALAYLLLDGSRHRRAQPLSIVDAFLRGYHEQHALEERELAVLFPLVLQRLCFSVVRATRAAREEPSNTYSQVSAAPAWEALERLARVHPRRVEWTARHACGYEPVPHGRRLQRWLRDRKAAPVLGVPLHRGNTRLVDFSHTNPEFAEVREPGHEPSVTRWTSELLDVDLTVTLRAARPGEPAPRPPEPIGWGRWDEPRLVYAGDQFAGDPFAPLSSQQAAGAPFRSVDQQRTIHLGVDLFAPPGAPVWCPLDAVVASVADNDQAYDYGGTVLLEHQVALELDDPTPVGERAAAGGRAEPVPSMRFFTLYGHLDPGSIRHLSVGQSLAPGDQLGVLGDPSCNGGWTPHLHFQIVTDLLEEAQGESPQNFPGVAPAGERELWLQVCPDPTAILLGTVSPSNAQGEPTQQAAETERSLNLQPPVFPPAVLERQPISDRRRRHLSTSLSLSYRSPLLIVRGRGAELYDELGRRYVDLVNNVCHVGHAHPRVVEALRRQATLLNTNTRYLHPHLGDYAERLLMRLPEQLEVCFFVNSGSEANDLALRLARTATGRELMFCLEGAYHGHTAALIDVSPYKHDGEGGRGTPANVAKLALPDPYRGARRGSAASLYAQDAREHIAAVCAERDRQPAAILVESILGCGGQVVLPEGYLASVFEAVRERGGVCIVDEVQVGFGRVGSHFWGFELSDVEPDIVTLGKPIGNGHPLAAVITTREIATAFDNGMEYFNTFGGNPVSCAVGNAVLDVLEEENLQRHAWQLGRTLIDGLRSLQHDHPCLGDVRGSGLFLGVEVVCCDDHRWPDAALASFLTERLLERGFLLSTDGPQHNVLKIKPPLVLGRPHAELLLEQLDDVLRQLHLPTGLRCPEAT